MCVQVTPRAGSQDQPDPPQLAEVREIIHLHNTLTWPGESFILSTVYGNHWLSTSVLWHSQPGYWLTRLIPVTRPRTRSLDSLSDSDSSSVSSLSSDDVLTTADARQFVPRCDPVKYKTEVCNKFDELGECKYGWRCHFAHGQHELRQRPRPAGYKTRLCKKFHEDGICNYGRRCVNIH